MTNIQGLEDSPATLKFEVPRSDRQEPPLPYFSEISNFTDSMQTRISDLLFSYMQITKLGQPNFCLLEIF